MFKFLRKYSVWILGFGGTLLLIAFLAPNVIQQLAQQAGYAGTTQAKVGDSESVGYEQWQQNVIESQVIDTIGGVIPGVGEVESPSHWFLLSREADLAGLTPPLQAVMVTEENLIDIVRKTGASPQNVLQALAHLQGVQRLVRMYQSAGRFSDRRLHRAADDYFSTAEVETVIIPATPEANGSFSEEEMKVQLDAWSDTPEGEGDHGFGYKMPNRFKAEWITIPTSSIQENARQSSEFSSREQRKFWRRNENDPRFPAIDSTDEIPESVSNAYLDQLTEQKRTEIARLASELLRNPRRGLAESNGSIILPEDWSSKQLSFERLAETLQEKLNIPLPEYGAIAEWKSVGESGTTPVLGNVIAINLGDTPVNFETLITSAKEFDGSGLFRIQENLASPVLEDMNGDLYLFRLTETDPTRMPLSLDEVRDQVTYDLGRIARWKTLQAEVELIQQSARENGLLGTSLQYSSTVNPTRSVSLVDAGVPSILGATDRRPLMAQAIIQRIAMGQTVDDMSTTIPALEENDRELIQSIIDHATNLPLDVPVSALPVDKRIFVVESPENMALVLVRVTGTSPASSELAAEFTSGNNSILQTLISFDELGGVESIGDAFSFERLAERHNFERGSNNLEDSENSVEETEIN